MAVKEKITTKDRLNRHLSVEQTADNCLNFQTINKKEDYEVNFYVFSENEINELMEKQKRIYELIDIEISKSKVQHKMERVLQFLKSK